ncbi:MAG: glycerol-3-phosphate dehydrogenase C-terminal domain-containing protein, partial [Draconibacterium sp.]|nr:glycerol-3-phosphate dehydrogenase C-terminal domain-containing protein [Draconibacterium sp.]
PDFGKCQVETLAKMYGTEMGDVLELAEKENLNQKLNRDGEIEAQVIYAIRNEMAVKLSDVFMRRTGVGTLGHPGKQVLKKVAELAAKELNWTNEKMNFEIAEMEEIFMIPG